MFVPALPYGDDDLTALYAMMTLPLFIAVMFLPLCMRSMISCRSL
jgi:hypothetical protein